MTTLRAVRGMPDYGFAEARAFERIRRACVDTLNGAGFSPVWLPVVEPAELFARAVGETTDIVGKEMYTFADRNDARLALRPEGTAGCARAFIEHNWGAQTATVKMHYCGPMFRYERPQKGRYRQFYQIGAEVFGGMPPSAAQPSNPASSAITDAEVISLTALLLARLGIKAELTLNSIGDAAARAAFRNALVAYLTPHKGALEELDAASAQRLTDNPLRILDSKVETTQALLADAPKIGDFLTDASLAHVEALKAMLTANGIAYRENPHLVRGLDYYNDTVFEWVSDALGAQATVCGGGRYDGLVGELGGKPTPAFGFAAGMERLALLLGTQTRCEITTQATTEAIIEGDALHVQVLAEPASLAAIPTVAHRLRQSVGRAPMHIDANITAQSLKSQLKRADKAGADIAIVIMETEWAEGLVQVKPLRAHTAGNTGNIYATADNSVGAPMWCALAEVPERLQRFLYAQDAPNTLPA